MKKLLPILTVLCLFCLNCEQGWIKDILVPPVEGCTDSNSCNYNSDAEEDDGSCLTNDCAGECGGLAVVDSCLVCDIDISNDCIKDCLGAWGGSAIVDTCGICDGNNLPCAECVDGVEVELWGECYNIEETTHLQLGNSGLTGEIPSEIGSLTSLTTLYLSSNELSGVIPESVGNLTSLTTLYLSSNELSGEIPESVGNLTSLTTLYLSSNELSGEIPSEIGNLTSLTVLSLGDNQLTGEIPQQVCNLIENNNLDINLILAGTNLINTCQDCAGVPNGSNVEDNCGTCDSDATNDCVQDCAGIWGGSSALEDCAGVCGGSAVVDCAGVCGGTMVDANSDGFCDEWVDLTVTDVDGNSYETVQIGYQLWMQQNLKTTKYKNSDEIHFTVDSFGSCNDWSGLSTGAYAVLDVASYADTYGNLYNLYALADERGICPVDWHIPLREEWDLLIDYLGGVSVAGGKMKEAGTDHWDSPNTGATNESGFTALATGMFNWDCNPLSFGKTTIYWRADDDLVNSLSWDSDNISIYDLNARCGMPVRCLKD